MSVITAEPTITSEHPALARALGSRWQTRREGRACYGELLSGAALVGEFLKFCGAEVIFGIPGGASLPLNDALTAGHHAGAFRYILTGHEQGAGFEAAGFAAASGRPGFCTATSGPAATNLITPLVDAMRDSRPLIALTGNTATTADAEAFQGLDIAAMTGGTATKASFRPAHVSEVQRILVEALHTATTGRPGSVLVDLPRDVQVQTTRMQPWDELLALHDWSAPRGDAALLEELARLLAQAERPVVYAGHGTVIAGASEWVRALSRTYGFPVATTVHGLGILPADDPLNLGMLGMHGTMPANLAPYLADVVLVLGARFDDRVIGAKPEAFAPTATVVHIDVDSRQLNRVRHADLAIHGDVCDALQRLWPLLQPLAQADRTTWHRELAAIRQAMPAQSYDDAETEVLSHEWVYATMARLLQRQDVPEVLATFDVGNHQMKAAQWFPVSHPRTFLTSGGMGAMGCALPMAVGAQLARPDALVLTMCGDGGFVMSTHELDTIGGYNLPIKMIVFDDAALGMVGNQHRLFCEGRTLTSDRRRGRIVHDVDLHAAVARLQQQLAGVASSDDLVGAIGAVAAEVAQGEWPLFTIQAAAYGIPAERVHRQDQFIAAFRRALETPGPYLLQVMLPGSHAVYPMIVPGSTPQDIVWRETTAGSGVSVYAREHYDYQARRLK
jgi:acetolactate synthase-1/2/3 large subunit